MERHQNQHRRKIDRFTSPLVDYKYVLGLVVAGFIAYWANRETEAHDSGRTEGILESRPGMRDRELDDLKARIASLEHSSRNPCK